MVGDAYRNKKQKSSYSNCCNIWVKTDTRQVTSFIWCL